MRSRSVYKTAERSSVCLSRRAAGLLLSAMRAGDIDRHWRPPGAQQQRRLGTALSSKLRSAANASSAALTADVGG